MAHESLYRAKARSAENDLKWLYARLPVSNKQAHTLSLSRRRLRKIAAEDVASRSLEFPARNVI